MTLSPGDAGARVFPGRRPAEMPRENAPFQALSLVIATDPSEGSEGSNLSGREIASVDSNRLAPSQGRWVSLHNLYRVNAGGTGEATRLTDSPKSQQLSLPDQNVVQKMVVFVFNFFDYLRTIAPVKK